MHRLPRPAATVPDFFQCGLADQIGPNAVESHRRTHAALFERRTFRHPDQEPADCLQGEEASFPTGIHRLRKERIIVGFHSMGFCSCPLYALRVIRNRGCVAVPRGPYFALPRPTADTVCVGYSRNGNAAPGMNRRGVVAAAVKVILAAAP